MPAVFPDVVQELESPPRMGAVKVLVVANDFYVRLGLAAFLRGRQDVEVVGEAPDEECALGLAGKLGGGVLLLGVREVPEAPRSRMLNLTRREREVLSRVTEGASNDDVGRELGISKRTVEVHISSVLEKLDARSRTEAAFIARRQGLI
jgi:DNA-binding NarL/FixJ family response regulator